MRPRLQCALIGWLVATLVAAPAQAAPATPLGTVLEAERATLGAGEVVGGTTLFDGDRLATRSGGTLRVGLGASQLYLLENSAAALRGSDVRLTAAVTQGTVVFATTAGPSVELLADTAHIRPISTKPTVAQLTVVGPWELLLASRRGALEISLDREVETIPEGASYRVLIQPEAEPQGPQGAGAPGGTPRQPAPAAKNRFLLLLWFGTAAATGIVIWRALISPDKP